jgi:hypothetical protein
MPLNNPQYIGKSNYLLPVHSADTQGLTAVAGRVYCNVVWPPVNLTISHLVVSYAATINGNAVCGIYAADANFSPVGDVLIQSASTPSIINSTVELALTSPFSLTAGIPYVFVVMADVGNSLRAASTPTETGGLFYSRYFSNVGGYNGGVLGAVQAITPGNAPIVKGLVSSVP